MSRARLESWLLERSGASALLSRSGLEENQREIRSLEAMLTADDDRDWGAELQELRRVEADLERELAETEQSLQEASERLAARADNLLARLANRESAGLLDAAQRLYDTNAPNHLSQPLSAISLPLLRSELAQSSLVTDLARWLTEKFDACTVALQTGEDAKREFERGPGAGVAGQASLETLRDRLGEHEVDKAVITAVRELKDQQWFLEEVLEPYLRAASTEAGWHLSRSILEEL